VQSRPRDSLAGNPANILTHGASGIVVFKETIFDFSVDRVRPLFRMFGLFPVSLDLRLELRNAIFRGAKLVREPLCGIQRLSAVLLGGMGGLTKELQDRLAGLIKLRAIGARTRSRPFERDYLWTHR
jgi:hypothetical protein